MIVADGHWFGAENTWPGLDSWQMAGAYLVFGAGLAAFAPTMMSIIADCAPATVPARLAIRKPSMAAGMTIAMNIKAASTSARVKPAVDRRRALLIAAARHPEHFAG